MGQTWKRKAHREEIACGMCWVRHPGREPGIAVFHIVGPYERQMKVKPEICVDCARYELRAGVILRAYYDAGRIIVNHD